MQSESGHYVVGLAGPRTSRSCFSSRSRLISLTNSISLFGSCSTVACLQSSSQRGLSSWDFNMIQRTVGRMECNARRCLFCAGCCRENAQLFFLTDAVFFWEALMSACRRSRLRSMLTRSSRVLDTLSRSSSKVSSGERGCCFSILPSVLEARSRSQSAHDCVPWRT